MTVTDLWTPTPKGKELALVIGALCSDATLNPDGSCAGDPTETAIVLAAQEQGFDKNQLEREFPRVAELPFDSTRKRMTTVHPKSGGGYRIMVKGAADVLLARSTHILRQGVQPLNADARTQVEDANTQMANQALRVLGLAYKEVSRLPRVSDFGELEKNLTFIGLVGMIDPPRAEVKAAVQACHHAGIRPVMITGDHKATAVAIAQELGFWQNGDLALTGADLDFLPEELLEEQITRCSVFARVSPEHKLRIVQTLQRAGQVVAMTGDGVNDAPALKVADIGCAMGHDRHRRGQGGGGHDPHRRQLLHHRGGGGAGTGHLCQHPQEPSTTCSPATSVRFLPSFWPPSWTSASCPCMPVQLLWLNLVTDSLPALALGVEPVEEDVMEQPPRPASASLFSGGFCLPAGLARRAGGAGDLGSLFFGGVYPLQPQ